MNRFIPICIEWNCYNGLVVYLLKLDLHKPINIDSSFLGINVSREFLYIDIFWKSIKIFDKTEQL